MSDTRMAEGDSTGITVIVPVYNQAGELTQCLTALRRGAGPDPDIIVVDDASTDDSPGAADRMGARVLRLSKNSGPAAARNYGALHARGDILFFVDADVVVAPGAREHVRRVLAERPDVDAVFGSYDAHPQAGGVVSQYRNLLHHFVHQHGNPEASTFWAGCGAVRRAAFDKAGGFDAARFPRSSIEDIELGYRLRQAGHRILLDKTLQGTHLKRWKWPAYVWSDITRRAIPWARLILETGTTPNDLNLKRDQRLSAGLMALGSLGIALAPLRPAILLVTAGAFIGVVTLNRPLFAFFVRQRGVGFAAACVPLHLFYYLYSTAGYALAWAQWRARGRAARPAGAEPGGVRG